MSSSASPLQNRVAPLGDIVAIPQRGSLMGNRGCLHDDEGAIRHGWQGKRWITCRLEYKGNRVPLRAPGRYTPLFFKDEVSALAAGHRPCAQCRREAYRTFIAAVEKAQSLNPGSLRASDLDAMLHRERIAGLGVRPTLPPREFSDLPNGAMFVREGSFFVIRNDGPAVWDWEGYSRGADVWGPALVTPPTIIEALRAGYLPATRGGND